MQTKENVFNVIASDERFRILAKILENTGISNAMCGEKEAFTFFAPTDTAFCKLSEKALDVLTSPEGKGLIAAIIGQHLVPSKCLYADDLRRRESVVTVHGNELKITKIGSVLHLEKAHILMPSLAASNGVIFAVDKVLPVSRKVAVGA